MQTQRSASDLSIDCSARPRHRAAKRHAGPGRLAGLVGLTVAILTSLPVQAAPDAASARPAPVFGLKGTSLDGRAVDIGRLRGKVVMVFYWSTSCRVCMQKMPELRANAAGWRGKPFELILVNTDAQREDVQTHARLVRLIEPGAAAITTLWMGDAQYRDSLVGPPPRLPLTLVLDVKGALAARHEGRIAPEAWDAVADLLP